MTTNTNTAPDLRDQIMDVITGVWDRETQIGDAADTVIDLCALSTAAQQPAPREPLTDAEIEAVIDNSTRMHRRHLGLVRGQMFTAADSADFWVVKATEAAHGITAQKEQSK